MSLAASPAAPSVDSAAGPLSSAQLEDFQRLGFVVLEGFLPAPLVDELKREVDVVIVERGTPDAYAEPGAQAARRRLPIEFREHGRLVSHPPLMDAVTQLLGPGFHYHHLHTTRHDSGAPGVSWHHDYEQHPQTNRTLGMVHAFHYLNGLDGSIGDLLVLPGTHRLVMERNAYGVLGAGSLPGEMVIDRLPPGSTVIVHSALQHARRAKPGGEGRPRYFIDASYCQAGARWPGYRGIDEQCRLALELGLDRAGRYAHLFDRRAYFDVQEALATLKAHSVGSLVERL